MVSTPTPEIKPQRGIAAARVAAAAGSVGWRVRLLLFALFVFAGVTIWFTNVTLTQRFTETTRNRAELRLALYSANILSELQRNSIVPQLLARDPTLISALNSADYTQTTQRLLSFVDEIGAASLSLLDREGRTVATTERVKLGSNHRSEPYFVDALRSTETVFTVTPQDGVGFEFRYTRSVTVGSERLGVISVEVDLSKFERSWAGIFDAVFLADSTGQVILSTEPRWRGKSEQSALELVPATSAIERAIESTSKWGPASRALLSGQGVMRQEARIPFRGWRLISFTGYTSVREQVNGVLALEIMGFAMLLALAFYLMNRRSVAQARGFQQESAELRSLNTRLQQEIAERQRVQADLKSAEQTLAQSSKLAALGEMSAAVSHELNQPLAAMKTYLAGAKLLLERKRAEEAIVSFRRIDDLIERMGAITRQLKSYARKAGDSLAPVDMRDAVTSALAIMEPQLKARKIRITKTLPQSPAIVLGDRLRLEQVIINLLRNAFDATNASDTAAVDILLTSGEQVLLAVRDNGQGIENFDDLFEPFYTTKQPGDGVGLGLAISSGIVTDLGGRLTARNAANGGAVFEVVLPIYRTEGETGDAAE
jgi:two-component system C4-dicarboxylate transport sensor histidine kinase DctB